MDYEIRTGSPDSLEDMTPRADVGVIKVSNHTLLSQLVSQSPLPIYKPKEKEHTASTFRLTSDDDVQVYADMEEYQFVPTDIDDDLNLHTIQSRNSSHHLLDTTSPLVSTSPKISRSSNQLQGGIPSHVKNEFIPPLKLTDSLIADDPEPNDQRVVRDSLDSSFDEADLERLENLMSNDAPLPNPFKPDIHTPTTMKELDISAALAANSASPQRLKVNSQMSNAQISVMSSYAEENEATPRNETHSDTKPAELQGATDSSYLAQYRVSRIQLQEPITEQEEFSTGSLAEKSTNIKSHTGRKSKISPHREKISKASYSDKEDGSRSPKHGPSTHQQNIVGTVAPKPPRPEKNFIEKNVDKARGVSSAKSSYSSRYRHAKQQQDAMKEWAPGMIVPRKKAASADNAVRGQKDRDSSAALDSPPREPVRHAFSTEELQRTPETVWEQRAAQLTAAKSVQAQQNGSSRAMTKNSSRYHYQSPGRESIIEARIQVNVDLDAAPHQTNHGMRLIGPILPQQPHNPLPVSMINQPHHGRFNDQAAVSNFYNPPMDSSSYSIKHPASMSNQYPKQPFHEQAVTQNYAQYRQHTVESQSCYKSQTAGPIQHTKTHVQSPRPKPKYVEQLTQPHVTSTVMKQSYMTGSPYHNQVTGPVGGHYQQNYNSHYPTHSYNQDYSHDIQGAPTVLSRYDTMSNDELDRQVEYYTNASYNQHYITSHPTYDGAASRWDSQQKVNKPSENEITLDEVIAMEENQSYERPPSLSQSSSGDLNPYQAVPPIQSTEEESAANGYYKIHKAQKEKDEKGKSYKQYTLKDYKKLNKEVKLGGLGPSTDPSELQKKHELRKKQLELAKEARDLEAKKSANRTNSSKPTEEQKNPSQPSRMQLAKEYSKTVPKPKVAPKQEETTSRSTLGMQSAVPPIGGMISSARSMSSVAQDTYRVQQTGLKNETIHFNSQGKTIPNSFSTPTLNALGHNSDFGSSEQFSYLDTIETLHRRHLQEKQLLAGLRQKI